MAEYESVLCVKQEVFVYKIPARTSNRGYRAAEWKLDEPDWTGRLKVVAKQRDLFVKLEDKTSGELFAQCPVESYPSSVIEQVLDSSRYFVIRIQDGSGRHAFIGLGFADRGDSFDLLVAIQDHFKHVKREETEDTESRSNPDESALNAGPKLDLSFKEGQTIKLNFVTKKSGEGSTSKPRPKGQAGASAILLPPPPGGVKIAGPPRQAAVGQQQPAVLSMQSGPPPTFSVQPKAPSNSVAPPPQGNVDLLLDLGINSSVTQPSASHGGIDAWDDFASAGSKPPTQQAAEPKTFMWENFD